MPRYEPISTDPSSNITPTASRRSSFASIRRTSISSFRFGSSRLTGPLPDPEEMDAAFDGPEDEGEQHGLLANSTPERRVPGDYDFERDYVSFPLFPTQTELISPQSQPPSSPPPFQPYSSHNPAPGNTNGVIPSSPPVRPGPNRHFLGGLLPTSLLPRAASSNPTTRVVGAGQTGVFTNLSARPAAGAGRERDGPEYVPEDEQKEGPPVS